MKISGVLLAAGCSTRMGAVNKLFLEYNKHTIFEEVLTQLSNSILESILVVTGFEADKVASVLNQLSTDKIISIYNDKYQTGRASSICCAVDSLAGNSQALLFMVADKPKIKSSLIDKAVITFREKQPEILYVQTKSGRGHPIIFSQKLFPELLELEGDLIGNNLIEKYKSDTIIIKDTATQYDIDTYEDYTELINREK